jgi:hypothetical protein
LKTQVVNSIVDPLHVTVSGLQIGSTDPTKYVTVRLTNGTNFYTASGSSGGGSSDSADFDVEFPTFGVAAGFTNGTNLVSARAFDLDSGAGTQNVLGVNLRLAGNGGSVEFGTSSAPIRTDPTGTTTQPVSDAGGSLTVDGTVSAIQSGAWNVTNVTGTVSLPTGAATAALQTTGNADLATLASTVDGTSVRVEIVGGSSSGTEYTEGDVDASITGTAVLWEDAGNTLRSVSAATPFPVEIVGGSSSGTEYTEGDVDASITGVAVLMESGLNTLVPLQGTPQDGLRVDLGTNNDVVASQAGTWNITNVSGTVSLPTGASTAALQTTGNTSLATLAGAVAGTEVQVDVLTMPTTTVQATNLDIRDLTNADIVTAELSAVDNAVLDAIAASLNTLDNTVAGNELQVDVLTMPTVTVTATDLDTRNLSAASDSVTLFGNTGIFDQLDLTSCNPAAVAIVDGNGDQITSFGGGTQYTQGDTDASITGTAMLMEAAADTLVPLQGTIANGLLVDLGSNNDVVVSATNLDIRDLTNADVVTAELSAVDNAVLDAIAASLNTLDNTVAGNELQVDVLTMPTVTVTATNLDIRDLSAASDTVSIHGDVGLVDQFDLANSNPLAVALVDATGNHVVVASGIQYKEFTPVADGTGTGTAIMFRDTDDAMYMVDVDNPFPVRTVADSTHGGTDVINVAIVDESGSQVDISAIQYEHEATSASFPVGTLAMWHSEGLTPVAAGEDYPLPIQIRAPGGTGSVDVLELTNTNSVAVAIVDGDGTQITSFGGGTQYTEGDTDATITGTAILWEDGSDTLATVSAATPLPVEVANSTNVAKLEDDASASADAGIPMLAVRRGTPANSSGTDGDYEFLQVSGGKLWTTATVDNASGASAVNIQDGGNSITVDNAALSVVGGGAEATALRVTIASDSTGVLSIDDNGGSVSIDDGGNIITVDGTVIVTQATASNLNMTEASAASILTAVQLIDDMIYVDDTATHATGTSKGALFMAAATPTDASVNANDIGAVAMTTDRKLHVSVQDALPAGSNAIGKLAANTGVDIGDVDVTSIVPGTGATNLGKAEDAGHNSGDVGVMSLAVRADAGATGNPTTLATTDLDYIPLATDSANRLYVNAAGSIAHDSPDSTSSPIKVGGQARTTNPTAVADADRVNFIADDLGRQVVVQGQVRDLIVHQHTQIANSSSETTILSAAASTFHDLVQLVITNQTATACTVTIKDGTGGTTRMIIALAASGGAVIPFTRPVPQSATNANWTATLSVNTVTVNFFAMAEKNV